MTHTHIYNTMSISKVEKSRKFRREGADVHTDLAISLAQAVLGGSVRTEGIYDNILINVSVTH